MLAYKEGLAVVGDDGDVARLNEIDDGESRRTAVDEYAVAVANVLCRLTGNGSIGPDALGP